MQPHNHILPTIPSVPAWEEQLPLGHPYPPAPLHSQWGGEEAGDPFYPGKWEKCPITVPLFKPQKRLFTLDSTAQNQTQKSSFSICLRELTGCSGELQSRASAMRWLRAQRPSASPRASWNVPSATVTMDPCPWLRHWLLTHFTEETEFPGSETSQSRQADLEGFHASETLQAFWTLFSCSVLQSPDPEIYSCFPEMGSVTEDLHKEESSKTSTTLLHLPVQSKKHACALCRGLGGLCNRDPNHKWHSNYDCVTTREFPRGKGKSAFPGTHKAISQTASLETICLFKWELLQ